VKPIPETEAKFSEIGGPTGSLPARGMREAPLAVLHELTERLTAITNYLEAVRRLFKTDAAAAGVPLRLKKILEKAFGQVSQADETIKRLRQLLDEDARPARPPSAGE
jgi:hypothetical protein